MSSASTCPWVAPEVLLAENEAKGIHLRKGSPAPWGNEFSPAPSPSKPRQHLFNFTMKDTCPWGDRTEDRDSVAFEKYALRRQRSSSRSTCFHSETNSSIPDVHTVALERAARRRDRPPPSPAAGSAGAAGFCRRDGSTDQLRFFKKELGGSPESKASNDTRDPLCGSESFTEAMLVTSGLTASEDEVKERELILQRHLARGPSDANSTIVQDDRAMQKVMQSPSCQRRHFQQSSPTPGVSSTCSYEIGNQGPPSANGHITPQHSRSPNGGYQYPDRPYAAGAASASFRSSLDPQTPGHHRYPRPLYPWDFATPQPPVVYLSPTLGQAMKDPKDLTNIGNLNVGQMTPDQQQDVLKDQVSAVEDSQRTALVRKCMMKGMTDDEIVDALAQLRSDQLQDREQQMLQQTTPPDTKQQMLQQTPPRTPPKIPQIPFPQGSSPSPNWASLTPSSSVASLAAKRAQSKEVSQASVGAFDEKSSRQTFMDNRSLAAAARQKMSGGSGIF